jgi:hypothetical protein
MAVEDTLKDFLALPDKNLTSEIVETLVAKAKAWAPHIKLFHAVVRCS